jgi:hypothetical protein
MTLSIPSGKRLDPYFLILFIVFGVARKEVFSLLVNFLLVFIQAFTFPECIFRRMRLSRLRIDRVAMLGDHDMQINRTVVLYALQTEKLRKERSLLMNFTSEMGNSTNFSCVPSADQSPYFR